MTKISKTKLTGSLLNNRVENRVSVKHRSFLTPNPSMNTLDIFIVRSAILNSLKTHLKIFNGILLDVGCGQMPYKRLLTSNQSNVTRYIGLDLQDSQIHKNNPDITWSDGKIPLADDSIDCAIATEVLEHCPEPKKVMREISRVLKPNVPFFFTVPFLWPLHEIPYDEYRYTPFAIKRLLSEAGFTEIELKPLGGWDASLAQMIGLWVRRRQMPKWLRIIISFIFFPVVLFLYKLDRKTKVGFDENSMITGLSGIARKVES